MHEFLMMVAEDLLRDKPDVSADEIASTAGVTTAALYDHLGLVRDPSFDISYKFAE